MNSNRSAISAIASVQGQPVGQHLLVSRFLKGVFQERPSLSRCRTTWAPDLIFRLLATEARSQHCFIYYSVVQEVYNLKINYLTYNITNEKVFGLGVTSFVMVW